MASANLFLDKSRSREGGHPVCIRVCHMRKQWLVTLKLTSTVKDYLKCINNAGTLNEKQKKLRDEMLLQRKKAQDVLDNLTVITKDNFNQSFYSEVDIVKASQLLDMESQFNLYIYELNGGEQVRSAEMYTNALRSLLDYRKNLNLQDIDVRYLKGYETHMKNVGCSMSTISMYLRCLRSIFNRCFKAKKLNKKHYPFEDYKIFTGKKSKDVLYPNQVEAFYMYEPKTEAGVRCKSFWFFSFLANGMNPKDIMSLKYKDLKGDKLTFERHKTIRTRRDAEPIVLFLHPYLVDVIKKYGNKAKPDNYIFPLFNDCENEQQRYIALKTWKRQTNRILGRMAPHLGIEELNMSLARHSMATSLAMKNINVSIISRMMGHSRLETTTHYLHSLPDETMRDINNGMLDFKHNRLKAV